MVHPCILYIKEKVCDLLFLIRRHLCCEIIFQILPVFASDGSQASSRTDAVEPAVEKLHNLAHAAERPLFFSGSLFT
jgi:hypothetical protein